jgi:large subunit ribosomal protein L4
MPSAARPKTGPAEAPVLGAGATKNVKLDESAFGARFNGPLVHQSVRAEQAARRRGTAATKTRGMVSGGSAKPWRQKGTGRARAGSSRSPIWTGGGVTFGPQPRSYTFKVNRKEQRAAFRSALSLHAERASIAVLDAASFSQPRTRQAADLLDTWDQPQPTLVVLTAEESAAGLSFRNLDRVAVLTHENVGVADLLGAASLVVSQTALDAITARAAGGTVAAEKPAEAKVAASKAAPAESKPASAASKAAPAASKAAPAASKAAPAESQEPVSDAPELDAEEQS